MGFDTDGPISFSVLIFLCVAIGAMVLALIPSGGANRVAIYVQKVMGIDPQAILESAMPVLTRSAMQEKIPKKVDEYSVRAVLKKQFFCWKSPLAILQSQIPGLYFPDSLFQKTYTGKQEQESLPALEPAPGNNQNKFTPFTRTVNGVEVVFVIKNEYYPISNGYTGKLALSSVKKYIPIVKRYASQYDLVPSIPLAIMMIESGGNPKAVSNQGALGIMQITQDTANEWDLWDPLNPEDSIKTGVKILHYYDHVYRGNVELLAAAYNAGSGAVNKYKGIPNYIETQNYVKNFNIWYAYYKKTLPAAESQRST